MKVANCVGSCREIEEASAGQQLGEAATEHVRDCAKCQDFYESRLKLRQMVASLETVEAPADFGFRVRARIASEVSTSRGFSPGKLAIGFPSIVLTTLLLLVGAGFALRVWISPTKSATAVRTHAPSVNQPHPSGEQNSSGGTQELTSLQERHDVLAADVERGVRNTRKQRSQVDRSIASVRNKNAVTTRDFSSTSAPVTKQEDAIASLETSPVFPIEASSQPLRVSLDYANGGSRTISVPALSFGSERVLTGEGSSMVRTTKGVW